MFRKRDLDKKDRLFLILMVILAWGIAWKWFGSSILPETMAYYYRDYSQGFVAGGFMGSVMRVLYLIMPIGLYEDTVYFWAKAALFLYLVMTIVFSSTIYMKTCDKNRTFAYILSIISFLILAPMFELSANFAMPDMYMMIAFLLMLVCVLEDKFYFLLTPLSMVCVCISPLYCYRLLPILLLVLFAREKTKRIGIVTAFVSLVSLIFSQYSIIIIDNNLVGNNIFAIERIDYLKGILGLIGYFILLIPIIAIVHTFALSYMPSTKCRLGLLICFLLLIVDIVVKSNPGCFAYYGLIIVFVWLYFIVTSGGNICASNIDALAQNVFWLNSKYNYFWCLYIYLFMPFRLHEVSTVFVRFFMFFGK